MKNKFKNLIKTLCCMISCLSSDFLYAQIKPPLVFDVKLTYEVRYIGDSTKSESVHTELTRLLINDSISLFESYQSGIRDSALYFVNEEKERKRLLSELNRGSPILYKIVKKENQITTYDLIFYDMQDTRGIGFYYDEATPHWELTSDTSSIDGLLCQKAQTSLGGRLWTAWFTTEIPITDGPYKFSGLPGLVVRAHDERKHWSFELKGVESTGPFLSTLTGQSGFEPLKNKEDFLVAKQNYSENVLAKEELRRGVQFTADTRIMVETRIKSLIKFYSNWIELSP